MWRVLSEVDAVAKVFEEVKGRRDKRTNPPCGIKNYEISYYYHIYKK